MQLIKLNAIDSTNEFLKTWSANSSLENFTVVTAESQSKGKGQMGAIWIAEPGKNLLMSVFLKEFVQDMHRLFDLNILVSISIIQVLEEINIPDLSIKWPNDIMSYNKKIGGILIENTIKSNSEIESFIGVGLNVNQTCFENLPKASSLSIMCDAYFDKEEILFRIIENLKINCQNWKNDSEVFWEKYTELLFKKGVPMPFEDQTGQRFMGIILGVSSAGKLQIRRNDEAIFAFGIKEIQMLY